MAQRIEQMDTCDLSGDGKGCIIERADDTAGWVFLAKCQRHKDAKEAFIPLVENNTKNAIVAYVDKDHIFDAATDLSLNAAGNLDVKVALPAEGKSALEAVLASNVKEKPIAVTAATAVDADAQVGL